MKSISFAVLAAVLFAAGPALAAPTIVTPGLSQSGGNVLCFVVNVSQTKALTVEIEIRSIAGVVLDASPQTQVPAGGATFWGSASDNSRFCLVRVLKGGRSNAIVSFETLDDLGKPTAAVQAIR